MADHLTKPEKACQVFAYAYGACRDYLQARDGYEERDYAGRYTQSLPGAPYQDFWHFVLEKANSLQDGNLICMTDAWADGAEPWQQEILEKYLTTFGERDGNAEPGKRFLELYVEV